MRGVSENDNASARRAITFIHDHTYKLEGWSNNSFQHLRVISHVTPRRLIIVLD
jgi:hypothetical protein